MYMYVQYKELGNEAFTTRRKLEVNPEKLFSLLGTIHDTYAGANAGPGFYGAALIGDDPITTVNVQLIGVEGRTAYDIASYSLQTSNAEVAALVYAQIIGGRLYEDMPYVDMLDITVGPWYSSKECAALN